MPTCTLAKTCSVAPITSGRRSIRPSVAPLRSAGTGPSAQKPISASAHCASSARARRTGSASAPGAASSCGSGGVASRIVCTSTPMSA
jgi:hypothetical protein